MSTLYPEHDKLKEIQPLSQACYEFLEWLDSEGIVLARYSENGNRMYRITSNWRGLLARHFGIDINELERERQRILEEFSRLTSKEQP